MYKSLALITQNDQMRRTISRVDKIVDTDSPILLIGETGSGKEIFAEYIHRTSNRSEQPFVKISLSALPPALLESELFGHVKGSFTGASNEKKGLFEVANNGSIFLDDIDDTPLSIQTKLLRILESGEVRKIGDTKPQKINVRVISATKVKLKDLVEKGDFRSDLFYRLNVIPVIIPPLRERREDIQNLSEYFIKKYSNGNELSLSGDALLALEKYYWPGNVRELRNLIQRAVLFCDSEINVTDFPPEISGSKSIEEIVSTCKKCFSVDDMNYNKVIQCLEYNLLLEALKKTNGNQSKAAESIGLNISTFRDKLKKFKITNKDCKM